jgi:hypothetical protein
MTASSEGRTGSGRDPRARALHPLDRRRERLGRREQRADDLIPLGAITPKELDGRVCVPHRIARDALVRTIEIRTDGDASAPGEGVRPGIVGLYELEPVVEEIQLAGRRREARKLVAACMDV